jgi:transcriptional antiterminator RfaH
MEQWYVVHTKSKQEKIAKENLERQGYHCFLPFGKRVRRRRGNRYLMIEPFFPRYLFVSLDLGETNISPIRSTVGVQGLVRFGGCVLPVPGAIMEVIKNQAGPEGIIEQETDNFKAGQNVRIEEGVMAGYQAIFHSQSPQERAILLLNVLGRQSKVEVPLASIVPEE